MFLQQIPCSTGGLTSLSISGLSGIGIRKSEPRVKKETGAGEAGKEAGMVVPDRYSDPKFRPPIFNFRQLFLFSSVISNSGCWDLSVHYVFSNWKIKIMRALFLCLLLIPAVSLFSQFEKYQEGYLVLVTGDTIQGQLSWKKNSTPSDKVSFKKHELDHPQVYNWGLIAEILDKDKEQQMMVVNLKRNLEYISEDDYTIMLKDSTAEGPVPLRPLYKGKKLSLYTLYDKSPFFFV
jgi:hypothetical protein